MIRGARVKVAMLSALAAVCGACEDVPWSVVREHGRDVLRGNGHGGAPEGVRRYGGAGHQSISDLAVAGRAIYIVGLVTDGVLDLGAGVRQAQPGSYLARVDADGRGRWLRRFSLGAQTWVFPLVSAPTTDGRGRVAVTVGIQNEPLLLDGTEIVPRPPADATPYSTTVVFDEDGGLLWVGDLAPLPSLSAFDRAGHLYTLSGEHLLRREPDGSVLGDDRPIAQGRGDAPLFRARAMRTDPDGNLLILAEYNGTWFVGDTHLARDDAGWGSVLFRRGYADGRSWHRSRPGPGGYTDVAGDSRGNVVAIGRTFSAAGQTLIVDKLDAGGARVFSRRFAASSWQAAQRIAVDRHDDIVVAAYVDAPIDLGGGSLRLNGVGSSGEGNQLAIALAKLNPRGAHLWSGLAADDGQGAEWGALVSYAPGLAVDARGDILLAGTLIGAVEIGGAVLRTAGRGDVDAFLARFRHGPSFDGSERSER